MTHKGLICRKKKQPTYQIKQKELSANTHTTAKKYQLKTKITTIKGK